MAKNPALAIIRAQVRARHKAANKKVSRMQRVSGVELSGTKFDPRRDLDKVDKYNPAQLSAYMKKLDQFLNRKTQYVPDRENRPVPIETFKTYKKLENQYNVNIKKSFNNVKNFYMPSSDPKRDFGEQTIGEFMATRAPLAGGMTGITDETGHKPLDRHSRRFASEKGMRKQIKVMKQQADPKYLDRRDRINRASLNKVAARMQDRELQKSIKALTPMQFRTLFSYTDFKDDFMLWSEGLSQSISGVSLSDDEQDRFDTAVEGIKSVVQWAGRLKV